MANALAGMQRRNESNRGMANSRGSRWGYLGTAVAVSQAAVLTIEVGERQRLYAEAVALSAAVGRPMLLVGMPRPFAGQMPCAPGVTLDIDPTVRDVCGAGGVAADVQSISYRDGYFGAVAAFHVLEHLPDLESAQRAWRELWRVSATRVLVAFPRRWNLYASYLQPEHHLWVYPSAEGGDRLHVEEREGQRRTAWVRRDGWAELV